MLLARTHGGVDVVQDCQVVSLRFKALEQEGAVYTWGSGTFAQLGLDDRASRREPNLVTHLDGLTIASLSVGKRHSVALGEDGRIYTWGSNSLGQLGHGDTRDRLLPTSVRRLWEMQLHLTRRGQTFKPIAVAAGYYHTLVLVDRGTAGARGPWHQLFGFGDNSFGQLGCINDCSDDIFEPECKILCPSTHPESEVVLTPSELMAFSPSIKRDDAILVRGRVLLAGATHSLLLTATCDGCLDFARAAKFRCKQEDCRCVLRQEGAGLCVADDAELLVWGSNVRGQLGDGEGGGKWGRAEFPVVLTKGPQLYNAEHRKAGSIAKGKGYAAVAPVSKIVEVAVGHSHNLARLSNGSVYSWGSNYYGQLGLSDRRMRSIPTPIKRFLTRPALKVAAGPFHSAASVPCGQGLGWIPDSCDCGRGYKGYDCSIPCLGSVDTPCSGKGTFDRAFRLGDPEADRSYDCEPDGSCICLKGLSLARTRIQRHARARVLSLSLARAPFLLRGCMRLLSLGVSLPRTLALFPPLPLHLTRACSRVPA